MVRGYVNIKKGKLNIFIFIQHSTKTQKCYHGWELSHTWRAALPSLDAARVSNFRKKIIHWKTKADERRLFLWNSACFFRTPPILRNKKTIGIFFFCNKNEDNLVSRNKNYNNFVSRNKNDNNFVC
jgi:hypothetical protein